MKWAGAMSTDDPEARAHPQGQLQSNRKLSLSLQAQLSSSSEHPSPLCHCLPWSLPFASGPPRPSQHNSRRMSPAKGTNCNSFLPFSLPTVWPFHFIGHS